jgi:hypothetical protein
MFLPNKKENTSPQRTRRLRKGHEGTLQREAPFIPGNNCI